MAGIESLGFATDLQDAGRWVDILHPVTGEPTGIRFKIAGPDSRRQRDARYEVAARRASGAVTASRLQAQAVAFMAACILDWKVIENGEPIPFARHQVERVLNASPIIADQLDRALSDRVAFYPEAAE